jgi:hypothetical protein
MLFPPYPNFCSRSSANENVGNTFRSRFISLLIMCSYVRCSGHFGVSERLLTDTMSCPAFIKNACHSVPERMGLI